MKMELNNFNDDNNDNDIEQDNDKGNLLMKLGNGFEKMNEGYKSLNEKTSRYTYLIMLLGLGYEFFSNRALSNRVNELQGRVDNLYKQVNEMNKNKALEKK